MSSSASSASLVSTSIAPIGIPPSVEKQVNTKLLVPYMLGDMPLVPAVTNILNSGKYNSRVPVDADNRSLTMLAIKLYNATPNLQLYNLVQLITKRCAGDLQNARALHHVDKHGYNVLHYMAMMRSLDMDNPYLENRHINGYGKLITPYLAAINEQTGGRQYTALMLAARYAGVNIPILIKMGALVGIKDIAGNNVLHHMCSTIITLTAFRNTEYALWNSDYVHAVVDQAYVEFVDIMAPNDAGKTPLDILTENKSQLQNSHYQAYLFELNRAVELMKHRFNKPVTLVIDLIAPSSDDDATATTTTKDS